MIVGIAKIPDPRRNEVGSTVSTDTESGTLIRLGAAWIYDQEGLRQSVSFKEDAGAEHLVFYPGPHDVVVSLQGVEPIERRVGEAVTFETQALYDAATLHPLTGMVAHMDAGSPRLAHLRMMSTYAGGEAVDLNVVLIPIPRRLPPPQALRLVRRDTLMFSANLNYVVKEEVRVESWTAAATVESGLGQARFSSDVPATLRPAFSTSGHSNTFYVDGTVSLRRGDSRWSLHALGISAVSDTRFIPEANHQVALFTDARFEYGARSYVLTQISAEINDKLFQEFNWQNADYAGELLVGFGRRAFAHSGLEKARAEVLLGVRMGENRRIEVMEVRGKARGLGPYAILSGEFTRGLTSRLDLRAGLEAHGYSIYGLGPEDEGFKERGLNVASDLKLGRAYSGFKVRAGVTAMWWLRSADLIDGTYWENRRLLAPGISIETYL
jgi:hypothetical protein